MQNSRYANNIERIEKYGVILSRLKHSEIQMLREWRNDPDVNRFMGTHQYITPEAQEAWFKSVRNRDDALYFIAYDGEEPIGYWCVQNIDWDERCGEPGIIMRTEKPLAFNVAFAMDDFLFETLDFQYVISIILSDNKKGLRFNAMLGHVLEPGQEGLHAQRHRLTRDAYFAHRDKLLRKLDLSGGKGR